MYVFVRQDLPLSQQLVQSNHATYKITQLYSPTEKSPNLVVIGVPDKATLHSVVDRLQAAQIPHYCWHEPDYEYGFTAIATVPISGTSRMALADYKIWKFDGGTMNPGLNANAVTSAPVAQLQSAQL